MAQTAPSHYLNECWNIVNWTLRNKLQWNFNRAIETFSLKKKAFENVVWKMSTILSRPQCVKIEMYSYIHNKDTSFAYNASLKHTRLLLRGRENHITSSIIILSMIIKYNKWLDMWTGIICHGYEIGLPTSTSQIPWYPIPSTWHW